MDWYVEDDQPMVRLLVDKEKAALNGISEDEIARTMQLASAGYPAGLLHVDSAKEDIPLMVRLDRASRSDVERLQNLNVAGRSGRTAISRPSASTRPRTSRAVRAVRCS